MCYFYIVVFYQIHTRHKTWNSKHDCQKINWMMMVMMICFDIFLDNILLLIFFEPSYIRRTINFYIKALDLSDNKKVLIINRDQMLCCLGKLTTWITFFQIVYQTFVHQTLYWKRTKAHYFLLHFPIYAIKTPSLVHINFLLHWVMHVLRCFMR